MLSFLMMFLEHHGLLVQASQKNKRKNNNYFDNNNLLPILDIVLVDRSNNLVIQNEDYESHILQYRDIN